MKNHKIRRHQQKKEGIAGRIVVGIDPGKERHQASDINEYGIQIGNSFSDKSINVKKSTWRKTSHELIFSIDFQKDT